MPHDDESAAVRGNCRRVLGREGSSGHERPDAPGCGSGLKVRDRVPSGVCSQDPRSCGSSTGCPWDPRLASRGLEHGRHSGGDSTISGVNASPSIAAKCASWTRLGSGSRPSWSSMGERRIALAWRRACAPARRSHAPRRLTEAFATRRTDGGRGERRWSDRQDAFRRPPTSVACSRTTARTRTGRLELHPPWSTDARSSA